MVLISLTPPSAVELQLATAPAPPAAVSPLWGLVTAPPLPPHLEMEGSPLILVLGSMTIFS